MQSLRSTASSCGLLAALLIAGTGAARAQTADPTGYYPLESLSGGATVSAFYDECGGEEQQNNSCAKGSSLQELSYTLPAEGAGRPFLLLREDGTVSIQLLAAAGYGNDTAGVGGFGAGSSGVPFFGGTVWSYRIAISGDGSWTLQGSDVVLDLNLAHSYHRVNCRTSRPGECPGGLSESGTVQTTGSGLRLQLHADGASLSGALRVLAFDAEGYFTPSGWIGSFSSVGHGPSYHHASGASGIARPFTMRFGPAGSGGLEATFGGTYLEEVAAPYGFKVDGNWETGGQSADAQFTYGGQSLLVPLDQGFAEALDFDYGDTAPSVEADVLIGGQVVQTLGLDLDRRAIEPWMRPCASAAGGVCSPADFSADPGVVYRSQLAWPVSLEATRALENASLLTGLFGITGSARSDFGLNLHSDGRPTAGAMDTRFDLQIGRRSLGLGLTGTHEAQLLPDGASLSGELTTTRAQFDFDKKVGVLDLIPGASAALAALPPRLREKLSAGAGVSLAGSVDIGGEGTYVAAAADDSLRFDSGALDVQLALEAKVSVLPDFLRGVLRLAVGGGGELSAMIDLFPQPAVRDLELLLRFFMDLQIFKLPIVDIDHTWSVGRGAEAAPVPAMAKGTPEIPEDGLPAQADAQLATLRRGSGQAPLLVYSEPDPLRPAPASRIVLARQGSSGGWSRQVLNDPVGLTRLAPTYGQPRSIGGRDDRGVLVWAEASGTPPAAGDIAGIGSYLNSSELRFAFVLINSSLQPSLSPNVAPFRRLTDNALADFGPLLVEASGDGSSRLFWTRGNGLDLTGETTPLRLLNRNLVAIDFAAPLDDPDTIWSPETDLGGPLSHVLDWRAAAWDADNAAVVVVRDMDGDYTTTGDLELWLLRQAGGVWLPPRRLTDDGAADDAPQLQFLDAQTLVLGWRRGDEVVGTLDADAFDSTSTPETWFDADSRAADNWPRARLQLRPDSASLVMLWPADGGLYLVDSDWPQAQPGSPWPVPRHLPLGDGVVSTYSLAFLQQFAGQAEAELVVAMEQPQAPGAIGSNAEPARLERIRLAFGEFGEGPRNLGGRIRVHGAGDGAVPKRAKATGDEPLTVAAGATIDLRGRVVGPGTLSWQWFREGEPITGADGPVLRLRDVAYPDSGRYTALVESAGESFEAFNAELRIGPSTYAAFMQMHDAVGGLDAPFEDFDGDGVSNLLEYLAGSDPADPEARPRSAVVADSRSAGICLTEITLNPRAGDIDWRLEYSADGVDWFDFSALLPLIPETPFRSLAARAVAYRPGTFLADSMPVPPSGEAFLRLRVEDLAIDGHTGPCPGPTQCLAAVLACPSQQASAIELRSEVLDGAPYAEAGEVVRIGFELLNVGTGPLQQARIEEFELGALDCESALPAALAPGERLRCEGQRVIGEDDLQFDAILLYPGGRALGEGDFLLSTDTELRLPRYQGGPRLRLSIEATLADANGNGVGDAGETVGYALRITNTGDAEATDLRVEAAALADLACSVALPAMLAPAAELDCSGSLAITPAMLAAGPVLQTTAQASILDTAFADGRQRSSASASVPLASAAPGEAVFADGFEGAP